MKTLEKLVLGVSASLMGCQQFPYDTGIEERVVLYPVSPQEGEDLYCRVDGTEEDVFDFYWFVNRELVKSETDVSGLLESDYTLSGDYVECSAWAPASGLYEPFEYGTEGVYIL